MSGVSRKKFELDLDNLRANAKKLNKTEKNKFLFEVTYSSIFKILGETFMLLPSLNTVVLSIFNDVENSNSCIFSVLVNRDQWEKLDFDELQEIDVVNVINSFLPSIKLTKFFERKLMR